MATRNWLDVDGDWTNTNNWSGGAVPVAGDDVYIESGTQTIDTNLGQSAVKVASLNIAKNFTGQIGTTSTALDIGADVVNIGYTIGSSSPAGSTWIYLDIANTTACDCQVFGSASSSASSLYGPIVITADDSDVDITVHAGLVNFNPIPDTTGAIGDLNVLGGEVYVGHTAKAANTSIENVNIEGGRTYLISDVSGTVGVNAGTVEVLDDSDLTTVQLRNAGVMVYAASETINTLTFDKGGTFNSSSWRGSFTITTLNLESGGTIIMNPSLVTVTTWNNNDNAPVTIGVS